MKKFILSVAFLFLSLYSFAQGETNIWYFADRVGVDFNSGSPQRIIDGQTDIQQGCATIADTNGNLLFYTDGNFVFNRMHQIMLNGDFIGGNVDQDQPCIIIPKPNSSNIYYIITNFSGFELLTGNYISSLKYSEVDMNLDNGKGAITINKGVFISNNTSGKITAVKKGNDLDYWFTIHDPINLTFKTYSITSSGINTTPIVSSTNVINPSLSAYKESIKFSPDGTKLLMVDYLQGTYLYDFNDITGVLSNIKLVSNSTGRYGVEFSPSGKIAYISQAFDNKLLLQYDLTSNNIPASETIISFGNSNWISFPVGQLQLASNGKIYYSNFNSPYLGEISNPDNLGLSCNYNPHAVDVSFYGMPKFGLPNFVQSFFQSNIKLDNNCIGNVSEFSLISMPNVASASWDFGDSTPLVSGLNVIHTYSISGDFNVTVTITSNTGAITIKTKTIKIYATPIANAISNQSVCGTANMSYDLSQFNNTVLGSQSNTVFGVSYFSSSVDANANTNVLPVNQNLPLGATTFYAKIYNKANPSCNAITSFTVTLNQKPIANATTDYVICENAPYNNIEQFDLSTKNNQILNGQAASNYTITYHASQINATNDVGALPTLYTNTLPQEILYVRIENNSNPTCFATTPITIKVIQQPILSIVSDFKLCDDSSNNGIESFNLSLKTTEILNGQSPSTFEVKYYNSLLDAQNNTSEITTAINNTSNNQIIYFSISAIVNNNCKVIGSFNLIVNKLPIANTITPVFICDDVTNDGIGIFNLQSNTNTALGTQSTGDFTVSYYISQIDANSDSNALPLSYQNATNPQIIYVRVENNLNTTCFATRSFQIGLYKLPVANQPQNLISCDDSTNNGVETFNLSSQTNSVLGTQLPTEFTVSYYLTQTDANLGNNPLPSSYNNALSPQTIYARIANNLSNQCFDVTPFQLIVRQKPVLNMTDVYSICEGNSITIDAPAGFSSYTWSNGDETTSTVLTLDGNYSLTVTKNYGDIICNTTQNFVVYNSNIATINNIQISDWTANQNTIEIFVTGDGNYQYSIGGITYQDSPKFTGLPSGVYTLYVKDKKGCGIATDEVFLLMYPKFFTPNGDGYNDYWNIDYGQHEPELSVSIFDHFGKLIKTFKGSEKGWNGTFNEQSLPSTDYWFVVKRKDGKEYKGHFSLKR